MCGQRWGLLGVCSSGGMYNICEPCVLQVDVFGHVADSSVFSRDTTEASPPCFLALRWRWQLLTRQRAPLQNGETPLHCAAEEGKEGAIGVLLAAGADLQAKNEVRGVREGESGDGSGEGEGRKNRR